MWNDQDYGHPWLHLGGPMDTKVHRFRPVVIKAGDENICTQCEHFRNDVSIEERKCKQCGEVDGLIPRRGNWCVVNRAYVGEFGNVCNKFELNQVIVRMKKEFNENGCYR